MMEQALIMVAPNGARRTTADHPALPMTAAALGATARACEEAGAGAIHLHVRAPDGTHILDAGLYEEATAAVRRETSPDFVVQITTEAVGRYQPPEQMAVVRAVKPEAFSVAVRELFPQDDTAAEKDGAAFLAWCHDEKIAAQYILYSDQDLRRFAELSRRGIIPGDRWSTLFVLGRYSKDFQSDPNELRPFLEVLHEMPEGERLSWMVCAFGQAESTVAAAALSLGGNVRVGFENNLWLADGSVAADNAALVSLAAQSRETIGLTAAKGADARRILGMPE
ncbi:MAG: hypothetical protein C0606_03015 [Hyphomicrobiales bacterium]|nr:MAG: hypothetical protein C0606_03015 [Hyphomicrobiales bacterium]